MSTFSSSIHPRPDGDQAGRSKGHAPLYKRGLAWAGHVFYSGCARGEAVITSFGSILARMKRRAQHDLEGDTDAAAEPMRARRGFSSSASRTSTAEATALVLHLQLVGSAARPSPARGDGCAALKAADAQHKRHADDTRARKAAESTRQSVIRGAEQAQKRRQHQPAAATAW